MHDDEGLSGARSDRRDPAGGATPEVPPDELVALVMSCATTLDGMPEASTSARLALVADRLAAVVHAPTWAVSLAHGDQLFEVSAGWSTDPGPGEPGAGPTASTTTGFDARLRATDGGAFHADESAGDPAARRELARRGLRAVMGAGGYDQDGRAWLVEVFADDGTARLDTVTPVLTAIVQAALCFPRDALVPRPVDPAVRAILRRSWRVAEGPVAEDLDPTG